MNKTKVKSLINKYFEGETTLKEEQLLKSYFLGSVVDPELEEYRSLFVFFVKEKEEVFNKEMVLPQDAKAIPFSTRRYSWRWGIAAAISLLMVSWFLLQEEEQSAPIARGVDWSKYEPKGDENSIELVFHALKSTSVAMKNGTEVAAKEVTEVKQLVRGVRY